MLDIKDVNHMQRCSELGEQDWWYWEGWRDKLKGLALWGFTSVAAQFEPVYLMGYADAEGELNGYSTNP